MVSTFKKLLDSNLPKHLSLRQIIIFSFIYLFVSIGCLSQIVSICRLFFNYPTIVSVETEDRNCHNDLPAFSFCAYLEPTTAHARNSTKTIAEYFKLFNLSDRVFSFKLLTPDYETINETTVPEDVRNSLYQTINSVYVCYTFNSLIKCKF